MKKVNIENSKEIEISKEYFNGEVNIKELLNENNSEEYEMYHVYFNNGALTTIHLHESEQVLVGTGDNGILCIFDKYDFRKNMFTVNFKTFINKGDVFTIPANKLHFHGALRNKNFSHIAFRNKFQINEEKIHLKKARNIWEIDLLKQICNNDMNDINDLKIKINKTIDDIITK
ncbi:MAG: cupin domain-containing protein [Nitrososphaeraceae archaeon]